MMMPQRNTNWNTVQRIKNEIKLKQNNENAPITIILEGGTDEKLYEGLFQGGRCSIRSAGYKSDVIKLVKELNNKHCRGYIAILDRDYDFLTNNEFNSNNVFYTDENDIEIQILKAGALEKILIEYTNNEKIEQFKENKLISFEEWLLKTVSAFGAVRFINAKHKYNFDFQHEKITDYISKDLTVDLKGFVKILNANTVRNVQDIINLVNEAINKYSDIWCLCRGHDFTEVLANTLSVDSCVNVWEKNNQRINRSEIERNLRMFYTIYQFRYSDLYFNIYEWQKNNLKYSVLREINK